MTYPKRATSKASQTTHQRDHHHDTVQTPITSAAAWESASAIMPNASKLPALFISHGAPTLAIEQSATTSALARIGQNLPKPRAIVIMSAHWQSAKLEISSNPQPKTWHDFSGFAPELYDLQYPA